MERILALVVVWLVGSIAVVVAPASADHGRGESGADPAGGYHEEMPDLAVAEPERRCIVLGTVLAGVDTNNGQHRYPLFGTPPVDPIWGDPAHGHFEFLESLFHCVDLGSFAVTVEGGEDGHSIDAQDLWDGGNGDLVELDPVDCPLDAVPTDVENDGTCGSPSPFPNPPYQGADHDFNDHHGAVADSAWSNSSDYSGLRDDRDFFRGESNDGFGVKPLGARCHQNGSNPTTGAPSSWSQNRADLNATHDVTFEMSSGWAKYIRLGTVVYMWGCFYAGPLTDMYLSMPLALSPHDPMSFVVNTPQSFTAVGPAFLGPDWLIDTNSVDD